MAAAGEPPPPPTPPRPVRVPPVTRALPLLMVLSSIGMLAVLAGSGSPLAHNPVSLLFPVTMLGSALAGLAASGSRGQYRRDLDEQRRDYLAALAAAHRRLLDADAAQRNRLLARYPDPATLWAEPTDRAEPADPADPDFGHARIGLGAVAAEQPLPEPADAGDPVARDAFGAVLRAHRSVPAAPVAVPLAAGTVIAVAGDPQHTRALLRAMVCGIAARHRPTDLAIAAVVTETTRPQWEWLKWLPHADPPLYPDPAAARRGATGPLLLVCDTDTGTAGQPGPLPGACILAVAPPGDEHAGPRDAARRSLAVTPEWVRAAGLGPLPGAVPDLLDSATAAACARRLAADPRRPRTDWPDLLERAGDLRVPLGRGSDGAPAFLDIKEAAAGGMGPHGLCVGATGSGKSELLRTITLGMIAAHHPDELNLALIDFKGGATFLDLDGTGHTAAVITNLADEAHLVDRMAEALTGEINRRQQILREAGNLAGIADYRRARAGGAALTPLPTLLLIIDEFSELLAQHPEFAEVFAAIGRLGRSLGMHLLLATQRLEEGRLRGLESHLSYRICLRTLSAGESRAVLGSDAAYRLPNAPGAAYLQVGAADPVGFRAAYVSGPAPGDRPAALGRPQLFTAAARTTAATPAPTPAETVLARAAAVGARAHQIWLPPLRQSPALAELSQPAGALQVAIGLIDRVAEQRRGSWCVDLSGAQGNVAVIGGAHAGKSAAVATLIGALALRHGPDEICFCCVDFGGGALLELADLPQVAAVATRAQPDLVRRIVGHVEAELRRRDDGPGGGLRPGRLVLVIDGWSTLRAEFDALEPVITAIAGTGLSHGVHLILTAHRWADLRPGIKDQLGTRIELRLGEPLDSEIDRQRARAVPIGRPGAALAPDGLPATLARPAPAAELTGRLTARHNGARVAPVRLLPSLLPVAELPAATGAGIPIGVAEDDESSVATIDVENQPQLLVLGDAGTGKTALLRLLCLALARDPSRRFFLCDPRRTLAGVLAADRLAAEPGPDTVVVIDDHDLVGAAGSGALAGLVELLPRARDIGMPVLLARRSTGTGRASYEPLLAALREADPIGVQLGGNPEEPPVFERIRPRRLPPGRAVLLTRDGGQQLVQLAWSAPQ
ncbi:type VII secretion protein EccCb [Mycolicibacterium fallax]|uniref:type VII secretion protein EccCb n=2 Tax=Mycolicibacterium fallax TaxID=1793 RepID=UPI000A148160|nr:type VII secretion protein EccCb [Mycolicibacterium fallax]